MCDLFQQLRDDRPLLALTTFRSPEHFCFRLVLLRISWESPSSLLSVDMPTGATPAGRRPHQGVFDMSAMNLPNGFKILVLRPSSWCAALPSWSS